MKTENLQKLQLGVKYLAFFTVAIGLFLLSYSFFSKTAYKGYDRYLVNKISEIQKINDKSKDFTSEDSIDKDKAVKKLPSINSDLNAVRNDLTSKAPEESNENYDNLVKGLESNILIIQQLEAMVNNPMGKDIDKASENLKNYADTTNNYYSLINIKNINFSIGKQLSLALDNTIKYCRTSNNLLKQAEIKVDQYSSFITKIDELNTLFQNNKVDYYPEALKARKNQVSYELTISNIDRNITTFETIKKSLEGMVIPNDTLELYRSFNAVIDQYYDYLKNTKYALATESVHNINGDAKEEFLDTLYVNSKKLYSEVAVKHKGFLKDYEKFKKSKQ